MERVSKRASELSGLIAEFPTRKIEVINGDANDVIIRLCDKTDWRSSRGVVFLDPYGLQVSWNTLVSVAKTKAIDAWILFPSGLGLNRLLTKSGDIPIEWQETLDRCLGTKEWRSAFYREEDIADLFEGVRTKKTKDADRAKLEKFYLDRLKSIFPIVMDGNVRLTNSKDQTMYLLCFVSANPSEKVRKLAGTLASWAAKA